MDENGVDHAFIAPSKQYTAVYNREGNQMIADICRQYPKRFSGYAVSNPWYGEKAREELKRALDDGMKAVYFDSSIQGFCISDELVYPLIEICGLHRAPVYFHTGTPAFALPFQLHFLAKRFPEVTFIMGHSGANDFAGDALPALHGCPNILLDTSLNLTVSIQAMAVNAPDRMVFGSASPRSTLSYEIARVEKGVEDPELLEDIFGRTIRGVMKL
ncbi:MAG: amidohydrolase family protein [Lachnospiraceae bacterium]|jgi:predicted TIM-barrel fold metal-dependent hydrolase|nr:amidohydrolase family protein [Lachnospiraceae bacterium]